MEWLIGAMVLLLWGKSRSKNKPRRNGRYPLSVANAIVRSYIYREAYVQPALPHVWLVTAEVFPGFAPLESNAYYALCHAHAAGKSIWAPPNAELPIAVPVPLVVIGAGEERPPEPYTLLLSAADAWPDFEEIAA